MSSLTKDPKVTWRLLLRNFTLLLLCGVAICFIPESVRLALLPDF